MFRFNPQFSEISTRMYLRVYVLASFTVLSIQWTVSFWELMAFIADYFLYSTFFSLLLLSLNDGPPELILSFDFSFSIFSSVWSAF